MATNIQIEISEELLECLAVFMASSGITDNSDFFNNATALLMWAIRQKRMGRIIASLPGDLSSFSELSLSALDAIKADH